MRRLHTIFITTLLFLLAACGNDAPAPTATAVATETAVATSTPEIEPTATTAIVSETTRGQATVDSIEIQKMESFPVQISVRARGDLPDGCTLIEQSTVSQVGSTFNVTIATVRPSGAMCTQALVPFEEVIPLDATDLLAGTYTVNVNGITGSFSLETDNIVLVDSNSAIINGRVWHDVCAVATEGSEQIGLSAGCVAITGGGFEANGLLEDDEPGIANVSLSLGQGECPSTGLATTLTDADGDYVFDNLPAGDYCVSIDTEASANAFLLPGSWTFPGINETAVSLSDGEIKTGLNFGWDYQLLPEPDIDLANCTNSIAFVADLTIPDDTVIAPGAQFEKGWRLRNNGTCPWTPGYTFDFAGGDQMSAITPISITTTVLPEQEVSIFATLTAPETVGTYRSDWFMRNRAGQAFGVDGFADEVLWVQIVVGTPPPTPEANSSAIGGVVWEDVCFINTNGNPSSGCVELEGTGTFVGDGTLVNEPRLEGITVVLAEGACPNDGMPAANDILQTTLTDENGLYRFTNLDEGLYCIAIDALSEENVDLLIPGNWTWPALGTGRQGINLAAGEQRLTVDFGWDFQE